MKQHPEWTAEEYTLVVQAMTARARSYSPYSGFAVGAALLGENGIVYTGCNVENAAFGPSICAERTAVTKAVSEGCRRFAKIAIAGGKSGEAPKELCPPCGVCRQVLREFCNPDELTVLLAAAEEDGTLTQLRRMTLAELLPESFGPELVKIRG